MSLPTPKYKIGDLAWTSDCDIKRELLPCPDCLGKTVWSATTPAGETFDIACSTCESGWYSRGVVDGNLKPISLARLVTIGSVRIDTNDREHPISYMAVETGIGSGQVHYESRLFDDKASADADAIRRAGEQIACIAAQNAERAAKDRKKARRRVKR